jgi:hypothetical protein
VNGTALLVLFSMRDVVLRSPTGAYITAVRFAPWGTIVTGSYNFILLDYNAAIGPSEAGRTLGNLCGDIQVSSLFAFSYHPGFSFFFTLIFTIAPLHFGQFIPSTSSVDPLLQTAIECICDTLHRNSLC